MTTKFQQPEVGSTISVYHESRKQVTKQNLPSSAGNSEKENKIHIKTGP